MINYHFSFKHIQQLVKKTALKIQQDNFMPDYLVAIGAGGFIPARLLRTFINVPILVATVASYDDQKQVSSGAMNVIQWLPEHLLKNKKILVVDDIDDTRLTLQYCLERFYADYPKELRLFVLHSKQKTKSGNYPDLLKQIYIGETVENHWVHYPWDQTEF